jgi:uncharacterized membrane protein HdeD (DUF308 family)
VEPLTVVLLPISAGVILWRYLVVRNEEYELTNERLKMHSGVLNITTTEIELYRVTDTEFEQPFWLRLVGLAHVVVISSDKPMRLTWAGVAALAVVGIIAGATAWARPSTESAGVSLAALVAVACLVATIPTAAIAIVGEYVVRAYREAQGRPTWVVRRTLNAPAADRVIDSARAA